VKNKIKVCYVGDYSGNLDEGIKNVSYYLSHGYSKKILVKRADITKIKTITFWKEIYNYRPDVIHYLAGPSIYSLIISKILKIVTRSKVIISATHPNLNKFSLSFSRFLKPDLLFAQSDDSLLMFKEIGFNVRYLCNGVDLDKFHQVSQEQKKQLRIKYGIDNDKFTVLHVGHLIKARKLDFLEKISDKDLQFVIVVSTHADIDVDVERKLESMGCILFKGYFKSIEEFFQLSDCYIFPVTEGDSILTPLSVLEAMACNLPVITTKFGGLTKMFKEGQGLYFLKEDSDVNGILSNLKTNRSKIECRNMVHESSWSYVRSELEGIYEELLSE